MMEAIEIITLIGVWILIFWVPFQIKRLNETIDAQSKLISNFESQSEYLSNVQETMSRLYDPKEIETIVSAKVEIALKEKSSEYSKNLKKGIEIFIESYQKDISALLTFGIVSSFHLTKEQVNYALKDYDDAGGNKSFSDAIKSGYQKYQTKYQKALVHALRGDSNNET